MLPSEKNNDKLKDSGAPEDLPLILLVQPPIEEFYLTRKRTIPYGIASICASLEARGYPTQIIDALATDKSKSIPYPEGFSHLTPYYGRDDLTLFSLFHQFKHFGSAMSTSPPR